MLKRVYRLSALTKLVPAKVFHTPLFVLHIAQNKLVYNRYGFVVSKKVDKQAVVRNRAKRKIRHCIEEIFEQVKTGYDMRFFIKRVMAKEKTNFICLAIKSLLSREKLLK